MIFLNIKNSKQRKSEPIKETTPHRLRYLNKNGENKLTLEDEEKIIEYMNFLISKQKT